MSPRRLATLALALTLLGPAALTAQSFNLRDLLPDLLREGITLATNGHEFHFSGVDSEEFHALEHMSDELGNQLSNFPLASSAGGFTYRFDPSAGVFTRTANSFGPVYAERAESIGKGKFNLGLSFSHFTYDQLHALRLREGDPRLVFTHEDSNGDGNLQPFFEGDVITGQLFLKIDTDVTAFVMTYGLTDRLDFGLAVPIVRVRLEARTDLRIQRLATAPTDLDIHRFTNGTDTEVRRESGNASGVGDVILRGKYQFLRGEKGGGLALAADARLPTGDEQELLGSGSTRVTALLIGSLRWGTVSPHLNAGYTWNSKFADDIAFAGGFDWAANPRLTFAADVVGSSYLNATVLKVTDETFQANTNPTGPPTIVTATYPMLTIHEGQHYTTLLGSFGAKINPFANFLLTVNGLFPLKRESLQDDFAVLVAFDYSF